jgi:hypothetical protein
MLEAEMGLTAFQVHKSWFVPAAVVLVVTGLADALAAWFVPRPVLWCTLIAASLPITMAVFVAIPMLRQEARKS